MSSTSGSGSLRWEGDVIFSSQGLPLALKLAQAYDAYKVKRNRELCKVPREDLTVTERGLIVQV
jgi:hypothetical protein